MAEYLYDILATPILQKNRVPVLVVLNKGDLPTSQPLDRVEASLQNELYGANRVKWLNHHSV